jgi:hypothetical protein
MDLLKNSASPKIVLAGGSNIAFGIDSAEIIRDLNVPVINMGVHAGFGLGRILGSISPYLDEGDTLLIIPEYSHFNTGWDGDSVVYEIIIDMRQYKMLYNAGCYELPKNFFPYLCSKPLVFLSRFRKPNPNTYDRYGFNEYCDYVKHLTFDETHPFKSATALTEINQTYINYFKKFTKDMAERGITVLVSWPSYEDASFDASKDFIHELDTILRKDENVTVISVPEDYRFAHEYFYDTVYHLHTEGRRIRSERLIRDLLKFYNSQS